jgi:hypothetical protein
MTIGDNMKRVILITLAFLVAAFPAQAVQIQATWNPNTDGLTDGYYLSINGEQVAAIEHPSTTWQGDIQLLAGENVATLIAFGPGLDGELLSDPSDPCRFDYQTPEPPCTTRKCQCADKKGWFWLLCYYWGIK